MQSYSRLSSIRFAPLQGGIHDFRNIEKSSSHSMPTIGQASPQYERATRTITPSDVSGALKLTVISCQSFVPVETAGVVALSRLSAGSSTSTVGIPALFKLSVRVQHRSE